MHITYKIMYILLKKHVRDAFHSNTVMYILLSTHDINGKQTAPSLKLRCSNSYVLFVIQVW